MRRRLRPWLSLGPRPSWGDEDWQELYRYLGVYLEQEGSPTAQRQRSAAEAVGDYAHGFAEAFASGLHELVPVGFASGSTSAREILAAIEAGDSMVLVGASGSGKTTRLGTSPPSSPGGALWCCG